MKRYTITTERGIKIQVSANGYMYDRAGSIVFYRNSSTGGQDIVCLTPPTSTIEVNDPLPDSFSK